MPITDRSQAKDTGFAQIRAAMTEFIGTVTGAEFGMWGGKLVDDEGNPVPPREFLEISTTDVEVTETTEELSMPVDEWNFRVNCSEFNGSFWVDKFLEASDKLKLMLPDDLEGKRIRFRKVTLEAREAKYNSTNFIPVEIVGDSAPAKKSKPAAKAAPKKAAPVEQTEPDIDADVDESDPMDAAVELAVGKTEQQFRSAILLKGEFDASFKKMAKSGLVTGSLVNEGRLVLDEDEVYQLPE